MKRTLITGWLVCVALLCGAWVREYQDANRRLLMASSGIAVVELPEPKHYWSPHLGFTDTNHVDHGFGNITIWRAANFETTEADGWNTGTDNQNYISRRAGAGLTTPFALGTNYTGAAWAKPDWGELAANPRGHIISADGGATATRAWYLVAHGTNNGTFYMQVNYAAGGNSVATKTNVMADYGSNVWLHVAGVVDPTTIWLYINGLVAASTAVTGTPIHTGDRSGLAGRGEHGITFNVKYHGYMDRVRLYTNALSAEQINYLYQTEKQESGR